MKQHLVTTAFAAFLLVVSACATTAPPRTATPSAPQPAAAVTPFRNPNQEINDRYVQQIAERIAARKSELAAQVFENVRIEWLKTVPAETFLAIMNIGYSRALGVSCTHCHDDQKFASDEKRPKRAAREMAVMHRMINQQLRQMENVKSPTDNRSINCFSCHRGTLDPKAAS
jgi:hypothetical protein